MKPISIWRILIMGLMACYISSYGLVLYAYYREFLHNYSFELFWKITNSNMEVYFDMLFFLLINVLFYGMLKMGWTVYKEKRAFGWMTIVWFSGIFLTILSLFALLCKGGWTG